MSEKTEIESYLSAEEVNIIEEQLDEEWNKNPTPVIFQYKSHNIVLDAKFTDFTLPFTIRCRCLLNVGHQPKTEEKREGKGEGEVERTFLDLKVRRKQGKIWTQKDHYIATNNEKFNKKFRVFSKPNHEEQFNKLTEIFQDETVQSFLLLIEKPLKNGILKVSQNYCDIQLLDHTSNNNNDKLLKNQNNNGDHNKNNENMKNATKKNLEMMGVKLLCCYISNVKSIDRKTILTIFNLFAVLLDLFATHDLIKVLDINEVPLTIRPDGWASLQWVKETSKPI